MTIRITGLSSGLDTDSIVADLVSIKQVAVDKQIKLQGLISVQQDVWKELNTKIYSFYSKVVDNMRYTADYSKKTTTSSNESAVSIITSSSAVNSTQTLQISSLAKTAYLTGGKLDGDYTSSTKLSDADGLGIEVGSTISLTVGGETTEITVDEDMTINGLVQQLQSAGVNASFDETNQRFFISGTETGAENDFTIEGVDPAGSAMLDTLGLSTGDGGTAAGKIDGSDAVFSLNGVEFTSSSNTATVNGLTFSFNSVTAEGEEITLTTKDDTSAIYDMVCNFITEYNSLINEMDSLYNASSNSDYLPLTSDEKSAMSDSEIADWEAVIKESILSGDDTLSSVASVMKSVMSAGITVNGQTMYLSNFGIETLSYFSSAANEKNAYHVAGSSDFSNASADDQLMAMIMSDPDAVTSFFAQLANNLYSSLSTAMQTGTYSSAYTVYDDKKLASDYSDHETKIADLQAKLEAYEDYWYNKFAAMEVALSKLDSNASAISSLFSY